MLGTQIVRLTKEAEETATEQKKNGKEDPAKNEALQKLTLVCANLVNSRFFNGKEIPSNVVKATLVEMASPTEILNPFKAPQGKSDMSESSTYATYESLKMQACKCPRAVVYGNPVF